MSEVARKKVWNRSVGSNVWINTSPDQAPLDRPIGKFEYNVLSSEDEVGQAMFNELVDYANKTPGDIVIVLLGGRGAQAMYRIIATKAATGEIDKLLSRLHVFTQDALAPMRMNNGLSFVRDFERLLG
ncbi:MAG TPA: hypothetical protein VJL58_01640, partial [Pyrinomonadaceae bacterium]|nr:hypothetical protein [Pyrinomonadaceae bacterium]